MWWKRARSSQNKTNLTIEGVASVRSGRDLDNVGALPVLGIPNFDPNELSCCRDGAVPKLTDRIVAPRDDFSFLRACEVVIRAGCHLGDRFTLKGEDVRSMMGVMLEGSCERRREGKGREEEDSIEEDGGRSGGK